MIFTKKNTKSKREQRQKTVMFPNDNKIPRKETDQPQEESINEIVNAYMKEAEDKMTHMDMSDPELTSDGSDL